MEELRDVKPALEADRALSGVGLRQPGDGLRVHVVLLPDASTDGRGVTYGRGGRLFFLPWSLMSAAHAAEIGEPEGVQTVVFDLVLTGLPGARCRLDADPGEPARRLAQAIEGGLGRSRCTASLRAVALEGYATRSYADLQSFEDDTPRELLRPV